jgi:hypothetical protein
MSRTTDLYCETMQKEATTSHIQARKQPGSMAQKGEGEIQSKRLSGRLSPSSTSNPTGAVMMQRSEKIKYRVLAVLEDVPQTRGDDMLLYIHVLRRFYWRIVKISMKDGFSMSTNTFKDFFFLPSYETCRRRRQEWQEIDKHRIARGEITSSNILPTERTIHKRERNENAHRNTFGHGQLAISDYNL